MSDVMPKLPQLLSQYFWSYFVKNVLEVLISTLNLTPFCLFAKENVLDNIGLIEAQPTQIRNHHANFSRSMQHAQAVHFMPDQIIQFK